MRLSLCFGFLASLGLFNANAYAADPMATFFNQKVLPALRGVSRNESIEKATECTNFDGTWKGSCETSTGSKFERSEKIIQGHDCTSLLINDMQVSMGGSDEIINTSVSSEVISTRQYPVWLAKQTVVFMQLELYFKWFRGYGSREMGIENGKLIEKLTMSLVSGDQRLEYSDICTLEKQP